MLEIESVGLLGWQCGDGAGMRGNPIMIIFNMINRINMMNDKSGLSDPEEFA